MLEEGVGSNTGAGPLLSHASLVRLSVYYVLIVPFPSLPFPVKISLEFMTLYYMLPIHMLMPLLVKRLTFSANFSTCTKVNLRFHFNENVENFITVFFFFYCLVQKIKVFNFIK